MCVHNAGTNQFGAFTVVNCWWSSPNNFLQFLWKNSHYPFAAVSENSQTLE